MWGYRDSVIGCVLKWACRIVIGYVLRVEVLDCDWLCARVLNCDWLCSVFLVESCTYWTLEYFLVLFV